MSDIVENKEQEPDETENDPELKRAKDSFVRVFNDYKTGEERVGVLKERMNALLMYGSFDDEAIKKLLESCSAAENEQEFVKNVFAALEPILMFRKENPEEFERITREIVMNKEGMKSLNEIMYYGVHGDLLHIHLAPARELGAMKLRTAIIEGLHRLAEIVKKDEEIKNIEATSWIVAHKSGAKLIEKLGFDIEGEVDGEFKQKHFKDEERKVSRAVMAREELLKRYLK